MSDKAIRSAKLTAAGILDKARARTAVTRAGGQIAPSKYLPNVPRAVHADGGRENGDDDHIYVVHGGSDFDQIDKSHSGRGEPGGIRPLGNGLYGYVLDHTDPENFENAIGWATRYSQKYGGNKKALHVYKIPKSSSTVFNGAREIDPKHYPNGEGYPKPIKGLGLEPANELNAYESHRANKPPNTDPAWWDWSNKGTALKNALKNAADLRMEHLPIGLTEVAIQNPKVATRIGKFSLDTPTSDILDAVKKDVHGYAAGGRIHAESGGKMDLRSKAAQVIRNQPQEKGNVDQMLAMMVAKGVKPSELLNAGRPFGHSVSKEELAKHFEDAVPKVSVDRLGGRDSNQFTNYQTYTLPGGENYREHLLHLPAVRGPDSWKNYRSDHWETPNVLAHLRMKDRDNGKTLHVEEVQSDWGQEGRERGFYDVAKPFHVFDTSTGKTVHEAPSSDEAEAVADKLGPQYDYQSQHDEMPPKGPYVGNTQHWTDLAVKHALTEAAKGGHDRVVFSPGEANADLYGQRTPISQATLVSPLTSETSDYLGHLYGKTKKNGSTFSGGNIKDEKDLIKALGKQHAKALLSQVPSSSWSPERSISEPDMVLGGHGMADYYNNIVHPAALKLLRQHDPSIQPESYDLPNGYKGFSLPMTDKARQSILDNGFQAFKDGGMVAKSGGGELDGEPNATAKIAPARPENGPQAGGLPDAGGIRGGQSVLPAPLSPHGEVDLQGLPKNIMIPKLGIKVIAGHNPEIRQVARDYARQTGINYSPPTTYQRVDPDRGKRIADAYANMAHFPHHPLVQAAYDAMKRETLAQYNMIKKAGVKMEFYPDPEKDPYHSQPRLMTEDVNKNKHMYVYPTVQGGFGTGKQPKGHENNPLLGDSGERWNGQPVVFNDLFRAVHDYFGHVKEGLGFRGDGEENAWRSHAAMYSPLARIALGAETRGQNSLLNYGPHGEHNQTASPEDTIYSPQKLGIMPVWALHEGAEFIKPEERAQMEAIYKHFGLGPEGFVEPKVRRAPSAFVGQQKMAPTAGMPPIGRFTSKPTLATGGKAMELTRRFTKDGAGATMALKSKGK